MLKGRILRILGYNGKIWLKQLTERFFAAFSTENKMIHHSPRLKFHYELPYGAIFHQEDRVGMNQNSSGTLFSVVSRHATKMSLLLYQRPEDPEPSEIIPFDPTIHRWGDVWSLFVEGVMPGALYHFQADGPFDPQYGLRFSPTARLIDPYAQALAGDFLPSDDGIVRPPKCVVIDDEFDWSGERPQRRDLADSVIYETHVKSFTRSPSSGVAAPGTYLGLIEKIPYLQSLGVTTVELMPVHEFPTNEPDGSRKEHTNCWGYDPLAFFAPHRGYAYDKTPGAQVNEFKQMILALHQAGIEVILDVVFNHTAEGNEKGPTLSFKGLGNPSYYLLNPDGSYRNFSGCGNTVNGNHPLMRELIFSCLRHWTQNYHIDGFRFDLASILSRDRSGNLVANPPVLEAIAEDPMLAGTKIIAEAWDAAGAYQVGSFGSRRWAEWNGRYRDDVRRFWRGDAGTLGALATRLCGSSDLYLPSGRSPESSVNFITSHDGFTLNDLVSYCEKHNLANGEDNRDGDNNNLSFNCGAEGPSNNREIEKLRSQQIRNFFATLFFSQGVPMFTAGDEARRTQCGNNNAWCQDNPISWFDWKKIEKEKNLLRFVRTLIDLRRSEPALRQKRFLSGQPISPGALPDIAWFSSDGGEPRWNDPSSNTLCAMLSGRTDPDRKKCAGRFHFLLMFNADSQPRPFSFPAVALRSEFRWRLFLDTGTEAPNDIYPDFNGPEPQLLSASVLPPKSLRVYVTPIPDGFAAAPHAAPSSSDRR